MLFDLLIRTPGLNRVNHQYKKVLIKNFASYSTHINISTQIRPYTHTHTTHTQTHITHIQRQASRHGSGIVFQSSSNKITATNPQPKLDDIEQQQD